jgi:threonine dehydrogenase-like Zn-dependent dehydrogenase
MCRRMKQIYPRVINLTLRGMVDLEGIVSHRFPLERVVDAFALNAAYQDNVVKMIIES